MINGNFSKDWFTDMKKFNRKLTEDHYAIAKKIYLQIGVNSDDVIERLKTIPISIQCWQGDDVTGFAYLNTGLTGGIQATGKYPGKARNADELRMDLAKAMSLIPGKHRVNLHSIYAETEGKRIERNELRPEHFSNWVEWAKQKDIGLDFNPTCFSHALSSDGFTLSHKDDEIRNFWIEHCLAARVIGESFGKALGSPCVTNIWIPDGFKDTPIDRFSPRERLKDSLDRIFKGQISTEFNLDSVESKLFGIGSESYVVGSHEFYLGYAVQNNKLLCLDTGHFHPTEKVSDKISAVLNFVDEILLHLSRPVRWDSDHVVTLDDELLVITKELVRNDFLGRTHIGLDFFDASINRVAAYVIGTRNVLKALLIAMLEPTDQLKAYEVDGDYTSRVALIEEYKTFPYGAVWDYYCMLNDVPVAKSWLDEIRIYEKETLSKRL